MSEQTIAIIFASFGVVATLVVWAFYFVVGKSLWDMRNMFIRTPGDRGKGHLGRRTTRQRDSSQELR